MSTTSADVRWRKSSRSGHEGGECVEVANLGPGVAMRDSKNPGGAEVDLSGRRVAGVHAGGEV
ncbi:DUF397 domain-containing protein [Actinomadura miaoliensis]|uniref:DUF397 domain-containing protein n=1 Tax=Actinomadura miaoliensis TaxID=430685 RepID=UPI0031EE7B7F